MFSTLRNLCFTFILITGCVVKVHSDGFESGRALSAASPVFFTADGLTLSTEHGTLLALKLTENSGLDRLGKWKSVEVLYKSAYSALYFQTAVRSYSDGVNIFTQTYLNETVETSMGNKDGLSSGYPCIPYNTSSMQGLGFLAYGGSMIGDTNKAFGMFPGDVKKIASGVDSGQLVLFNRNNSRAAVISTFDNFMSASTVYYSNMVCWGVMGKVNSVPANFQQSFIYYTAENRVTEVIESWGEKMKHYHKKDTSFRDTDFTINYLGYWTDNGAYYYYYTVPHKTYEDTVLAVKKYSLANNIPYRYVQYDSWFYPKGPKTGVLEWVGMKSVFPDGMRQTWEKSGWPVAAHNRYWSYLTPYAKSNGGQYNFITEKKSAKAIPQDARFWDDLMRNSSLWGLRMYEQDWLFNEFDDMEATVGSVSVARDWLRHMGDGAAKNGLTIQYCMCPPRTALQSLQINSVTQARASNDYNPGNPNWRIGVSSLMAHALGIAPFKDNFWTTTFQPGNPKYKGMSEPYNALNAAIATLSTGPVGPSDMIGKSNVTLIKKSHDSDGLILKPSVPIRAISMQILQSAFHRGGADGEVWSTYSDIGQFRFGIILAADLKNTVVVSPKEAEFGPKFAKSKIYKYVDGSSKPVVQPFGDNEQALLLNSVCTLVNFCLYHTTPILKIKNQELLLFGDLDKWVPLSPRRYTDISVRQDDVIVTLRGASRDIVRFSYSLSGVVRTVRCNFSASGDLRISVMRQLCF